MEKEFEKFLESQTSLEIWSKGRMVFSSEKERLEGLMDFINEYGKRFKDLIVFDKKVGRGAALLLVFLEAREVYSKLGSASAAEVFKKYEIKFYFKEVIPNIMNKEGSDLCPIEKLSLNNNPEEFLELLRNR